MSEEEVFLPEDSLTVGENGRLLVALIIRLREEMVSLSRTLKTIQVKNVWWESLRNLNWFYSFTFASFNFQNCKGTLLHVESRPSNNLDDTQFEVILKLDIARENLISLLKLMKQSTSLSRVTVASATNFVGEIPGS